MSMMSMDSARSDLLGRALRSCDGLFDSRASLPKLPWAGPGYHTRVANGTLVHPFRESLDCALVYLESGIPARVARANEVLERVLLHQDVRMCSPTYGIWPYLLEEPLEKMSPPDWNWADFCGIRLAHILCIHEANLSASLRSRVALALKAAALSIFRRNVGPGYTNIAIKGAVVTAIAGQLSGEGFLVDYGVERLKGFLNHCRVSGGFNEYNSPPYGEVVLHEIERGLLLLSDGPMRETLLEVHGFFWEAIAETLHLPTGQLCGPQSRAYQDLLTADYAETLSQRLSLEICRPGLEKPTRGGAEILPNLSFLVPAVPCPEVVREKLTDISKSFSRPVYVRSSDGFAARVAAVWRSDDACLGSVCYENLWTQRRPVLGYWLANGELAVLRVRMRQGGRDFASGTLRTAQVDSSLLAIASLATNKGDFHDHMDRPADGAFHVSDLEIVVQLDAPHAKAVVDEGGFSLVAGPWSAVVRTDLARFDGFSVRWECRETATGAEARAVIQEGLGIVLRPAELESCVVPFSLSLCPLAECAGLKFETRFTEGKVILNSEREGLFLEAPLSAGPVRDHFTR